MGIVLRALDPDLQRPLAVKVLLVREEAQRQQVHRFLREARITGQLQHPGIPPVHEVGSLADGRPFFAMKLIEGRTLEGLLTERSQHDLSHFVGIFEQVCQTVAYAHSRGVVHRDLKPGNVMVGAFGEVQVMDWGLARVLGEREDSSPSEPSGREEPAGSPVATQAGTVLGTLAYMAPEQARGESDRVDERADVFGLGSILCELLTGEPPYVGPSGADVCRQAMQAELGDAFTRLQRSGADADLIRLACRCLAQRREDRPANGAEVARAVSAWQEGMRARLRQAERERTEAQVKVAEERKRRWLFAGLAGALVALIGVAVGSAVWLQRKEAASKRERDDQAQHVRDAAGTALEQSADLGRQQHWAEAAAVLKHALARVGESANEETAQPDGAELRQQLRQALAEVNLVATLEQIRLEGSIRIGINQVWNTPGGDAAVAAERKGPRSDYATELRQVGLDFEKGDLQELAEKVRASRLREQLVAALDRWATRTTDLRLKDRLLAVARKADPDPGPWKDRFRDRSLWHNRDAVQRLAREAKLEKLSPTVILLLSDLLLDVRLSRPRIDLLERAQRLYPDDFWLNFELGSALLLSRARLEDAMGFLRAAVSLRPRSTAAWTNLACVLRAKDDPQGALEYLNQAHQLSPSSPYPLINLAATLRELDRPKEALARIEQARKLGGNVPEVHAFKGMVLEDLGDLAGAEAAYRETLKRDRGNAAAYDRLGRLFLGKGNLDAAQDCFRKVIDFIPHWSPGHAGFAAVLVARGDQGGAEQTLRKALALGPEQADAHAELGRFLVRRKKADEGLAHLIRACSLAPQRLNPQVRLIESYLDLGESEQASRAARQLLDRCPRRHEAYQCLSHALHAKGDLSGAEEVAARALTLFPGRAEPAYNVGLCREKRGNVAGAILAYREALKRNPRHAEAHVNLGRLLLRRGEISEAQRLFSRAAKLAPKLAQAQHGLARLYQVQGNRAKAVATFRLAVQLDPHRAPFHHDLGLALAEQGDLAGAAAAFRKALEIDRNFAGAHTNLGNLLGMQGKWNLALPHSRKAAELAPQDPSAHCNLGLALLNTSDTGGAVASLRRATTLAPRNATFQINLGAALLNNGDPTGAVAAFRQAILLEPANPRGHGALGEALLREGRVAEALEATDRALSLLPGDQPLRSILLRQRHLARQTLPLARKLEAVAKGKEKPTDGDEAVALAELARRRGQPVLAVRLYTAAFAEKPALAQGDTVLPFAAAHAAVAASTGKGDGDDLDDGERMRLRRQALAWLQTGCERWQAVRERKGADRAAVARVVVPWLHDPGLAPIRGKDALARLPAKERLQWQKLWANLAALSKP
jgi:tetratricopeptide (TPR) repeat protein